LESLAQRFFTLPVEEKLAIAMTRGGRAWRGYFPLGGELTSGRPDRKEGIYFGTELGANDPRVKAGLPLHGMNLYPSLPEFREVLLTYLEAVTALGQRLLAAIAHGLGLSRDYFLERYTRDPTVLFRIFNYPPTDTAADFGVGAHTDYGLLTLLQQDEVGGLEVWYRDQWLSAPPVPDSARWPRRLALPSSALDTGLIPPPGLARFPASKPFKSLPLPGLISAALFCLCVTGL
jgi:isopenicillin N synthase-like dioxygenase